MADQLWFMTRIREEEVSEIFIFIGHNVDVNVELDCDKR